jgi:hypothetical protein
MIFFISFAHFFLFGCGFSMTSPGLVLQVVAPRRLRDELPNRKISCTLREAQILIEWWRVHDNTIQLHNALGFRPPASERIGPGEKLPMNREAA